MIIPILDGLDDNVSTISRQSSGTSVAHLRHDAHSDLSSTSDFPRDDGVNESVLDGAIWS